MNPVPQTASSPGGKSLNTTSSHTPIQQQGQITSPSFDNTRRSSSSSTSAATRNNQSQSILAASRNNQNQRKQHRNSKKPRLADEDAMAESAAMRNANSRRGQTSITHLMQFSLPPRPQDYRNTIARGTRRGNIYGIGSGHHSSDKARYIHANYRFIVKPHGDYKSQALFADQHLDWNDVLQILASAESQDASCPICLSRPVAPRMAKCGHIFCLPCLIRYMHSSSDDKNPIPEKKARSKTCPICWDTIYSSETRPVRWYIGQEGPAPREGEDVVLRLVMRQPGSTLALPRDGADVLDKSEDIPWYFAAEVMDYARIMKGSEDYMMEQFDLEIEALRQQENEDELMFGEEPEWTRKAVNSVNDAKEKVKGIGGPPPPTQPTEKKPKRQPIQFKVVDENIPEMYFVEHTSKPGLDLSTSTLSPSAVPFTLDSEATPLPSSSHPVPTANPSQSRPKTSRQNDGHSPDTPYFFYQALLHYYLAPLDIRILKSAFGDFASFPSTLLPRVERVSTHVMDDELRKRTKYLAHLPFGCEVGFLECNWTDVVQPEILNQFKEDIERRRKRNMDKEIREEKDRQRAEKAEDHARWAGARQKQPDISPAGFSNTDYAQLESMSNIDPINASPPWASRQGSSFGALASPSTSPPAPRTVWGTTLVAPSSPDLHVRHDNNADDGWLSTWEQEIQAENDALVAQVQAASLNGNGESSSSATPTPQPQGQGKKKKGKKITLMSTTARRAA